MWVMKSAGMIWWVIHHHIKKCWVVCQLYQLFSVQSYKTMCLFKTIHRFSIWQWHHSKIWNDFKVLKPKIKSIGLVGWVKCEHIKKYRTVCQPKYQLFSAQSNKTLCFLQTIYRCGILQSPFKHASNYYCTFLTIVFYN